MCTECGCGLSGPAAEGSSEPTTHNHPHPHWPEPDRGQAAGSGPGPSLRPQVVPVQRALLEKNQRLAERNRGFFRAKNLLVLNLMSAPGSGKTTFIEATARALAGRLRLGVIVGDLATDNDAVRLRAAGIPAVQVSTGTICHLDAAMVSEAAQQLDLGSLQVLCIENVGNLVCPADFDLGEDLRVVLMSITEGEDKPLKYPPLFHSAQVAVLTKCDLAAAAGFNRDLALANLQRISHHATIFEVSARTGEGMAAWADYVLRARQAPKDNG